MVVHEHPDQLFATLLRVVLAALAVAELLHARLGAVETGALVQVLEGCGGGARVSVAFHSEHEAGSQRREVRVHGSPLSPEAVGHVPVQLGGGRMWGEDQELVTDDAFRKKRGRLDVVRTTMIERGVQPRRTAHRAVDGRHIAKDEHSERGQEEGVCGLENPSSVVGVTLKVRDLAGAQCEHGSCVDQISETGFIGRNHNYRNTKHETRVSSQSEKPRKNAKNLRFSN